MRVLKLPDGRVRALVQGLQRVRVEYFTETETQFKAKVEILAESEIGEHDIELDALLRSVKQTLEKAVALGKNLPQEVLVIAANLDSPGRLADLVASNLDLKPPQMQEVLEIANPVQRLKRVNELLMREIDLLEVQQKITMEARGEMDKSQREYHLRQQLKAIQQELGEGSELAEEIQAFRDKIAKLKVPQEPLTEIDRNLKKLERMHPDSSETAVTRTYLEWMTEMPWGTITEDNLDLKEAKKILDEDHYGLEKIKDRLVEYLAVRKLNPEHKGTILCFVGPPGTGKTSLGAAWPGPWGASSSASPWAASTTRARSVATAGPTWAPCRAASSRPCTRRRPSTRSSCWTKWTRSAGTCAAIPPRPCWKCWTPSRTTPSATTT